MNTHIDKKVVLGSTRQAWECKIGCVDGVEIPPGGDAPMRAAVEKAFYELTGKEAEANFSGWGAKFTESELAVIRNDGSWPNPPIAERTSSAGSAVVIPDLKAWETIKEVQGIQTIDWKGTTAIVIESAAEAGDVARAILAAIPAAVGVLSDEQIIDICAKEFKDMYHETCDDWIVGFARRILAAAAPAPQQEPLVKASEVPEQLNIDTPEFRELMSAYTDTLFRSDTIGHDCYTELIAHINAKLTQARNGAISMEVARDEAVLAEYAAIARAEAAESKLAAFRAGVKGLAAYSREMRGGQHGRIGFEDFYAATDVQALLAQSHPATTAVGCSKCGSTSIHACPGAPIPPWTPEKVAELHAVLAEYPPVRPTQQATYINNENNELCNENESQQAALGPPFQPSESIDTPEFRGLMLAASTAWPTQVKQIKALVEHVDARLAKAWEQGRQFQYKMADTPLRERAEAAEAERDEWKHAAMLAANNSRKVTEQLAAIQPAQAPVSGAQLAYQQMTPTEKAEHDDLVTKLDDMITEKIDRERRKNVVTIDFSDRRIADRRRTQRD